jgi:hypothetical protein
VDEKDEIRKLILEALRFHGLSEQLALTFNDELAAVWREWERMLVELLSDKAVFGPGRSGLQVRIGNVVGLRQSLRDALARARPRSGR